MIKTDEKRRNLSHIHYIYAFGRLIKVTSALNVQNTFYKIMHCLQNQNQTNDLGIASNF